MVFRYSEEQCRKYITAGYVLVIAGSLIFLLFSLNLFASVPFFHYLLALIGLAAIFLFGAPSLIRGFKYRSVGYELDSTGFKIVHPTGIKTTIRWDDLKGIEERNNSIIFATPRGQEEIYRNLDNFDEFYQTFQRYTQKQTAPRKGPAGVPGISSAQAELKEAPAPQAGAEDGTPQEKKAEEKPPKPERPKYKTLLEELFPRARPLEKAIPQASPASQKYAAATTKAMPTAPAPASKFDSGSKRAIAASSTAYPASGTVKTAPMPGTRHDGRVIPTAPAPASKFDSGSKRNALPGAAPPLSSEPSRVAGSVPPPSAAVPPKSGVSAPLPPSASVPPKSAGPAPLPPSASVPPKSAGPAPSPSANVQLQARPPAPQGAPATLPASSGRPRTLSVPQKQPAARAMSQRPETPGNPGAQPASPKGQAIKTPPPPLPPPGEIPTPEIMFRRFLYNLREIS